MLFRVRWLCFDKLVFLWEVMMLMFLEMSIRCFSRELMFLVVSLWRRCGVGWLERKWMSIVFNVKLLMMFFLRLMFLVMLFWLVWFWNWLVNFWCCNFWDNLSRVLCWSVFGFSLGLLICERRFLSLFENWLFVLVCWSLWMFLIIKCLFFLMLDVFDILNVFGLGFRGLDIMELFLGFLGIVLIWVWFCDGGVMFFDVWLYVYFILVFFVVIFVVFGVYGFVGFCFLGGLFMLGSNRDWILLLRLSDCLWVLWVVVIVLVLGFGFELVFFWVVRVLISCGCLCGGVDWLVGIVEDWFWSSFGIFDF